MKDRESMETTQRPGVARHAKGHTKHSDHASSRRRAEETHSGPQVIARIPRVTRSEVEIDSPRCDLAHRGRLFRPWLSARLLVGGVAILVVIALIGTNLTSRLLGGKTKAPSETASQETAGRPDLPAPDAPLAPRWNPSTSASSPRQTVTIPPTIVPGAEYRPGSTGVAKDPGAWGGGDRRGNPDFPAPPPGTGPTDLPSTAGTPTDQPILSPGPTWNYQQPVGALSLPASRPWETARGGDRVEPPAEGVLPPDLTTPPTEPVPAYRPSSRGGLVNRDGPNYRDPMSGRPSGGYQTAARPNYGAGGSPSGRNDWSATYPETGTAPANTPPAWNRNPSDQSPAPPTGYGYQNGPSPMDYPPPAYPNTDSAPNGSTVPPAGLAPYAPSVDPNGARLDGVIEKPNARTFNEYPRSSVR